ncbi:hypothetical protein ACIRNI_22815 [Streptomyces sp. NPDC093546]|uniref:hypothetical protein n=1 Tax=Streptomyces sp. NPDC093546 TaxID=3366040 RepID=UPI0038177325
MTGELRRGRGDDVAELGEDAVADGRGDHAALGHHHADRRAEPERLVAVTAYDRAGAPLRFLAAAAVLLRRFPGCDQGLAGEVDAAELGGHAITAPAVWPSRRRAASSGSRSVHGAAAACLVRAACCSRSCSSRTASRCLAVRSRAASAFCVAAATFLGSLRAGRLQGGRVGDLQELLPLGGDVALDGPADLGGDGGDVARGLLPELSGPWQ